MCNKNTKQNAIYYILEENKRGNTAGTKLKDDLMSFFRNSGYKPVNKIPLYSNNKKTFLYLIKSFISTIALSIKLSFIKKKTIVMVYPLIKINFWKHAFMLACKKNKIILLLFDLRYFQYKCFGDHKDFSLKEETAFLNNAYACIAHTLFEKQLLLENGLTTKTYTLEFLDYISNVFCLEPQTRLPNNIAFAGYLPRASFLNKVDLKTFKNISINIYGDTETLKAKNPNLHYCGSYDGQSLINEMSSCQFGLVWDGDDIDTFGNFYGGYEKYIIPHKAVSYINAGLPLIVWSDSALAQFVDKYNVGIKIKNINEIPSAISKIGDDEYALLISNVKAVQKLTSSCSFIKRTFNEILSDLSAQIKQ